MADPITKNPDAARANQEPRAPGALLAVDAGIRFGMAVFLETGKLAACRSQNYGSMSRLRRAVPGVLDSLPGLRVLAVEGGGPPADAWLGQAKKRGLKTITCGAEAWRRVLLIPRQRKTGTTAKHFADAVARRTMVWSGLPKPTALRHDAAEAVCIGLWAALSLGWLKSLPAEICTP